MARQEPTLLGLDLDEREIRIVGVEVKGAKSAVTLARSFPLPFGAIAHGIVMEPGTVVVALRRALEEIGPLGSAKAAVAISGEQSNFRTVSIPRCPDGEVPELVAGEVESQGSLGLARGPYDYFPVHPVRPSDGMRTMAVVGADAGVTQALGELFEGVGLGVAAFEPKPLALLRTAVASLPAGSAAFVLVVGPSITDAAYFVGGRLAAFRRLEIGTNALVQSVIPSAPFGDPDPLYGLPYETESTVPAEGWVHVDQTAVDNLAVEAQRTMEYVQREDREGASIREVLLATEDAEVESLAPMLERRFGLPTRIVRPPCPASEPNPERFSAAYGLAIRNLPTAVEAPAADLFTSQRTAARRVETKRNFLGAVFVSGLSVAAGLVACAMYNRQIGLVSARTKSANGRLATVRAATAATLERRAEDEMRYRTLRKEGVPLGTVMDYVVAGIDPGVGLKFVAVADDRSVRLGGEARDVTALARTTQALQTSPVLLDVALDRFDRDPKDPNGLLTFEISGKTVPADRLKQKERA